MSLRIALLGLLAASGPASGYDLAKKFETSVAHVWQAGHSQIYPELAKLTADGLVAVEAEGPRGRKIYTITPEGDAELRRWLMEHTPSTTLRSESALQAFLVPLLDPRDGVAVLRRIKKEVEGRLAELEALRAAKNAADARSPGEPPNRFGAYALDLGIRQSRAALEWAEDAMADLERAT
ncbi:PadR family transcriptional regulator [Microbispora corallina]|uniref:Transcriptional regulator n=1 Tax=Microbispora corallina TaxID=83302 RepID=A0ABQ4G4F9_9ACTN|nr:PadR family transcriptional regulator [Microbispora corallina]GIH41959.1 transcriptional regulator [Microbispora corallina]